MPCHVARTRRNRPSPFGPHGPPVVPKSLDEKRQAVWFAPILPRSVHHPDGHPLRQVAVCARDAVGEGGCGDDLPSPRQSRS
jgi:hypothetical protein